MRRAAVVAVALMAMGGCGHGNMRYDDGPVINRSPKLPRTTAERTSYAETSTYADVITFIDSLQDEVSLAREELGRTNEGRIQPLLIFSRPQVTTPEQARALNRPIVYVQANIHAGEVEGKEALLALVRDLASSPKHNVLDSIVLIAIPIYNADGNERWKPQAVNRTEQNGPESVGQRPNAQMLDLNRDYMKAEAPGDARVAGGVREVESGCVRRSAHDGRELSRICADVRAVAEPCGARGGGVHAGLAPP